MSPPRLRRVLPRVYNGHALVAKGSVSIELSMRGRLTPMSHQHQSLLHATLTHDLFHARGDILEAHAGRNVEGEILCFRFHDRLALSSFDGYRSVLLYRDALNSAFRLAWMMKLGREINRRDKPQRTQRTQRKSRRRMLNFNAPVIKRDIQSLS